MAAPALLPAKKILQDLSKLSIDWHDELPQEYRDRWERWKASLPLLEKMFMSCCVKPADFGKIASRQIHSFSDASQTGYGQVSYLRQENEKGDVHCAFLFGKARLAPVKSFTIPLLELTAAVLSVRITNTLLRELDTPPDTRFFWTYSTTVLKYLSNDQARYKIFVANRVQTIRDSTELNERHYVDSEQNLADSASRGVKIPSFIQETTWIDAPTFL